MKALLALAFPIILSTGCASIISGSDTPVSIASEPAGAHFEVRDNTGRMVHQGMTPNTVTLKNGAGYFKAAEYSILVEKDGHIPQTTNLRPSINGWYWGNILVGGLIGILGVDPATGAMYKLPEQAFVSLPKNSKN